MIVDAEAGESSEGGRQRRNISASLSPLCRCALNSMGHVARWSFLQTEHPQGCFPRSSRVVKASQDSCLPWRVKGMHSVRAIRQIPLLRVRLTGTKGLPDWKTVHTSDTDNSKSARERQGSCQPGAVLVWVFKRFPKIYPSFTHVLPLCPCISECL